MWNIFHGNLNRNRLCRLLYFWRLSYFSRSDYRFFHRNFQSTVIDFLGKPWQAVPKPANLIRLDLENGVEFHRPTFLT